MKRCSIIASCGICLTALFVSSGCDREQVSAQSGSAPAPVTVAGVVRRDVPVQIRAIAAGEPFATVIIKSRVAGQLQRVHVVAGQEVKIGDLLFEVDPRPFQIAEHEAQARLERDTALANNAQLDAQRMEGLLKNSVATQEEADKWRYAAEAAKATVRADQAAIDNARLQIEYSKIRAPIDGRAGKLLADLGTVVKADETELLTINQVKPIYVNLSVPEIDLQDIRKHFNSGNPPTVEVIVPPDTVPSETGKLSFVDNQVDQNTGQIRLRATFENANYRLWPGQFLQAILNLTYDRQAIVIPSRAIQTGQEGLYVFVVKHDLTVEMRPVKVRRTVGDDSVVESELEVDQRVVTEGQLRLVPGAKVQIKGHATTGPTTGAAP